VTNREYALIYVRRLLEDGYTIERAQDEALYGSTGLGADDPGFEIRRGIIRVPWLRSEPGEAFRFRDLAKETATGEQQLALI
jgi:hypothetical protein